MSFILAKKLKMTQIFQEDGNTVSVTLLEAGPCTVTQVRDAEKDGYEAVQIGFGEKKAKNISKPLAGHLKDMKTFRYLQEFRTENTGSELKKGDEITVDQFAAGDKIDVSGVSKGLGFSGVIRRHNFSRGPESHGSRHHREPGSIGSAFPQHVIKGRKLPGQHGNAQTTVQNLEVVDVDTENGILVVKGAIPGPSGSIVRVKSAVKSPVKATKEA